MSNKVGAWMFMLLVVLFSFITAYFGYYGDKTGFFFGGMDFIAMLYLIDMVTPE